MSRHQKNTETRAKEKKQHSFTEGQSQQHIRRQHRKPNQKKKKKTNQNSQFIPQNIIPIRITLM